MPSAKNIYARISNISNYHGSCSSSCAVRIMPLVTFCGKVFSYATGEKFTIFTSITCALVGVVYLIKCIDFGKQILETGVNYV